jgi:hypothetical protein
MGMFDSFQSLINQTAQTADPAGYASGMQQQQTQDQQRQQSYQDIMASGVPQDVLSYFSGAGMYDRFTDSGGYNWMRDLQGGADMPMDSSGFRRAQNPGEQVGQGETTNMYFGSDGKYRHDYYDAPGWLNPVTGILGVAGLGALGMSGALGGAAAGGSVAPMTTFGIVDEAAGALSAAGYGGSMAAPMSTFGVVDEAAGALSAAGYGGGAAPMSTFGVVDEGAGAISAAGGPAGSASAFTGQGLNPTSGGVTGLQPGQSSLGMTAGSPGASQIGAGIGSTIPEFTLPQSVTAGTGVAGAPSWLNSASTQAGKTALSTILQSAMGGNGNGGGGMDLNSLLNLVGGASDANRQGNASQDMLNWMNGQSKKVEGMYNPGTPEYDALWKEMSRKDAAAGRNSQYGPRSVDLAARIAQIKGENIARMTNGLAPAYANALNQNASKYAGMFGALGNNAGGTRATLGNIINALTMGGGSGSSQWGIPEGSSSLQLGQSSNDDIWDTINGAGFKDWWK